MEKPHCNAAGFFTRGLERREVEKRIYDERQRLTASAALHVYRIKGEFE